MANWIYTTNTVREAPVAWNALMERFSLDRGVSVQEVTPGVYEEIRYYSYTDEIGAENLPPSPNQNTEFWPAPSEGLHFFRGGYEHIVDDTVKNDLIASGVATLANFVLAP